MKKYWIAFGRMGNETGFEAGFVRNRIKNDTCFY